MKDDFSELIEYLDERFTKIDSTLARLEENKADKADAQNLLTAVDAYAHKADKYFQEMAALTSKVDRLDRWIHEIAEKVGVELKS